MNTDILAQKLGKLVRKGKESVLIEIFLNDVMLQGGNFLSELLYRTANKIKYLPEPEGRDDWQEVGETLLKKTGDCEDFTILIGAVLLRAGYPVLLKITASKDEFDHVYPLAWDGESWVALDGTLHNIGLGFEGSFSKSVLYTLSGDIIMQNEVFQKFWLWLFIFLVIFFIILRIILRGQYE
jgi:hypothetical protein